MNDTFEKEVRELLREIQKDYRKEGVSGAEGFQGAAGHDVFPGSRATVLLAAKEDVAVKEMTWGFLSPKDKSLLINARAETALEKPMFSESILNRRCVITYYHLPVTGGGNTPELPDAVAGTYLAMLDSEKYVPFHICVASMINRALSN